MSYRSNLQKVELSDFSLSHTGYFNTNDYMSFTTRNNNTTGLSISGTSMTLPPGNYLIKAMLSGNNTNKTDDFTYRLELNNTLVGSTGQTETATSNKIASDHVGFAFSIYESSVLKLKVVSATSNVWTALTDYSYIIVLRCV